MEGFGPHGGDRKLEAYGYGGWRGDPHLRPTPIPAPVTRASHSGAPSVPNPWSFNHRDAKRKKRIAKYKVYSVEAKVKATFRNGFRWIKTKCSQIVHGY